MTFSNEEVRREIAAMSGEGFFFSVFPVETVKTNMKQALVSVSDSEVERLWEAYKKAVIGGLAPYSKAGGGAVAGPLLSAMEKDTGYIRATIAAFLNALERAVKEQGWDWKWLDPRAAKEAGQPLTAGESVKAAMSNTGKAVAEFVKPVADPVTNILKYGAIALVAGAIIYGLYQVSPFLKAKRKRRK